MLIFGWKARSTTTDSGTFRCPNEGIDRRYALRRSRRWFTLFFIPVIPLKHLGEWVQCEGCGAQYHADVLARHPA